MGIYYAVLNLDKKQRMNGWAFGGGAKLSEMMHGEIAKALVMLLSREWRGDRIKIADDCGEFDEPDSYFDDSYEDISISAVKDMYDWHCGRGEWYNAHVIARRFI